jgi:hypothetical protein
MADRLDALTVREDKNGKSFWTKIGSAWPNKNGVGYVVRLDAMPAPVDGQFSIHLREPLPKDGKRPNAAPDFPNYGNDAALDDDVPWTK